MPRGELGPGKLRFALLPNILGRVGAKQAVADAQRAIQLQMGPVVERISEGLRNGFRPFLELLPIRGVAGAKAFRHAGRPHGAPLVMVAAEPDLREILESAVGGDFGRRQMAVVVEDRQIAGEFVIQTRRPIVFQQKVFGDKDVFHSHAVQLVRTNIWVGEEITVARCKGTVPFSSDENWDSPPLIDSSVLMAYTNPPISSIMDIGVAAKNRNRSQAGDWLIFQPLEG